MEKGTIVNISDNFRAVWDGKLNWVLEEYTDVYGMGKEKNIIKRQDWQFRGYYGSIPAVLKGLLSHHLVPSVFKGQEVELSEVIRVVEDANHRFRKVLDEY